MSVLKLHENQHIHPYFHFFSHSLSYCCSSFPEQDQRDFPKQKQVDHKQCQEEEQAMTEQLPLLLLSSHHGQHGRVIYLPSSPLILVGISFILIFLFFLSFSCIHVLPPLFSFLFFSFLFFSPLFFFLAPLKTWGREWCCPPLCPPAHFLFLLLLLLIYIY